MNPLELEQFTRTTCGCELCRIGCRTMPGMLVPRDIPRIMEYLSYTGTAEQFAAEYLEASNGTRVARLERTAAGDRVRIFPIATLVPARNPGAGDACIFLQPDGLCQIHPVSPFGCGYVDEHMREADADERSKAGLAAVMLDHIEPPADAPPGGMYHHLHQQLMLAGKEARPLADRREAYVAAKRELLEATGARETI